MFFFNTAESPSAVGAIAVQFWTSLSNFVCFCLFPVCLYNNTGYQCRCEDQFFLPCNMCSNYKQCDDIINGTCRCISGLPTDGHFCQPIAELTSKKSFFDLQY